ncbi:hypothetical protein [Pedobacter sp. Hv1]|uniref:hypothetical protein n=1 Tax=Pedobacter sp. Hv1 TaxID=1740090 RepID=UPI0006D89676|nr:hypothetical protein [Pedobacter sp. Hv1]KQC02063.1 hypothetical protein AQF98_00375 [Pedobacter sp. Hv1]
MNLEWQVCSIEQAEELHRLGVINPSDLFVWFYSGNKENETKTLSLGIRPHGTKEVWYSTQKLSGLHTIASYNAFTLSEIALMLGYTWVSNNVREAADRLIMEIKNGTTTANEVNLKLREKYNTK